MDYYGLRRAILAREIERRKEHGDERPQLSSEFIVSLQISITRQEKRSYLCSFSTLGLGLTAVGYVGLRILEGRGAL
jgi:hypothetical protein